MSAEIATEVYNFSQKDIAPLRKMGLVIDGNYESHDDVNQVSVINPRDWSIQRVPVRPWIIFGTESRIITVLMPPRDVFEKLCGGNSNG